MQQPAVLWEQNTMWVNILLILAFLWRTVKKKKKMMMIIISLGNFSTASSNSSKLISHYEIWLPFPRASASDLSLKRLQSPHLFSFTKGSVLQCRTENTPAWKSPFHLFFTSIVVNLRNWLSQLQHRFSMLTNYLALLVALSVLLKDPRNFYLVV